MEYDPGILQSGVREGNTQRCLRVKNDGSTHLASVGATHIAPARSSGQLV
jgi:hypothetical protein